GRAPPRQGRAQSRLPAAQLPGRHAGCRGHGVPARADEADKDQQGVLRHDGTVTLGVIPPTGRVLGMDWGTSRIGVAISDETQLIASPLDTLTRRTGRRLPVGRLFTLVERA